MGIGWIVDIHLSIYTLDNYLVLSKDVDQQLGDKQLPRYVGTLVRPMTIRREIKITESPARVGLRDAEVRCREIPTYSCSIIREKKLIGLVVI